MIKVLIPDEIENKLKKHIKKQEEINQVVVKILDNYLSREEWQKEFEMWDRLSDDALKTFEKNYFTR